jgi:hypothetical protein
LVPSTLTNGEFEPSPGVPLMFPSEGVVGNEKSTFAAKDELIGIIEDSKTRPNITARNF